MSAAAFSFQFHKGTIKTAFRRLDAVRRCEFQFHKGTIKTRSLSLCSYTTMDFNSIKVQLRRKITKEYAMQILFQFHKGTIKTLSLSSLHIFHLLHFNSIKVQLRHKMDFRPYCCHPISIP